MMANESAMIGAIRLMFVLVYLIQMNNALVSSTPTTTTTATNSNNNNNTAPQSHRTYSARARSNSTADSKSTTTKTPTNPLPHEQRLALQVVIANEESSGSSERSRSKQSAAPSNHGSGGGANGAGKQTKQPKLSTSTRKRPYDIPEITTSTTTGSSISAPVPGLERYSPFERHFYLLDPLKGDTDSRAAEREQRPSGQQQLEQQKRPIRLNPRNELIRTQHRAPLSWRHGQQQQHGTAAGSEADYRRFVSDLMQSRKFKLRFTTIAPSLTTTEFFQLLSSAHSPIKLAFSQATAAASNIDEAARSGGEQLQNSASTRNSWAEVDYDRVTPIGGSGLRPLATANRNQQQQQQHPSATSPNPTRAAARSTTTSAPLDLMTRFRQQSETAVLSPTITVATGDPDGDTEEVEEQRPQKPLLATRRGNGATVTNRTQPGGSSSSNLQEPAIGSDTIESGGGGGGPESGGETVSGGLQSNDARSGLLHLKATAAAQAAAESPLTLFNGKRQVTIIRHRPRTTTTTTTTTTTSQPTALVTMIPERIQIESLLPPPPPPTLQLDRHHHHHHQLFAAATTSAPQLVRLISKQKHKYDDNIISRTLTVVDNDAIRVPPNATSVHNNKLVVAIRPGRPQRRHPPTTQFPVYNIVAGITPPYTTNPVQQVQYTPRPPSVDGSVYGLLKPSGGAEGSQPASSSTQSPANAFGAQNIKFPAPEPVGHAASAATGGADSAGPLVVELPPERLNISVPDSANLVGPNKTPDKILVETGEHGLLGRPPDAVVVSDSTIISRPYGSNTVTNQDGIMKLSTTRRPSRVSTTKRINIISANTTVVTTSADQLHDVLSNFISGSHQQDTNVHHVNQSNNRPSKGQGIWAYLSNIFNTGVTTSAIAVLTLVKTIFVAILVMFLPPIALTAAIMQAVSIG